MIVPFGRQGPAATLRQHCPQMTRRRCKGIQNEMVPTLTYSKILNLCKYKMYQDVLIRTEVHQRVLSSTKVESPPYYFIQTLMCAALSTSNLFGQLMFNFDTPSCNDGLSLVQSTVKKWF